MSKSVKKARYSMSKEISKKIRKMKIGHCIRVPAKECVGYTAWNGSESRSANVAWNTHHIGSTSDRKYSVLSLVKGGCVVIRKA